MHALTRSRSGDGRNTLRITVLERWDSVTIQLEGRIAGPWVNELDRAWRELIPRIDSKRLIIDLRGVTFVGEAGRKLLAEFCAQNGGRILANTPMTMYVAQQIMSGHNTRVNQSREF